MRCGEREDGGHLDRGICQAASVTVTLRRAITVAVWAVAAGVGVGVVPGCAGERRSSSGITIDTLAAATGTACPVPLDAAVSGSGIERSNASTGQVSVSQAFSQSAATPSDTTTLDRLAAISVSCTLALDGQDGIRLLLVAGRRGNAGLALLPTVASEAKVDADEIEQVGNDMARNKVGTLVSVPGDAPVAVVSTEIQGASTAWMAVSGPSLSRQQVEQIARQLERRLR